MAPRVWFVTGTSTGFGRALIERALSQGDRVAATVRKLADLSDLSNTYSPNQLLVLSMDVTSPVSEIAKAFDSAVKAFGRIDIVVSNAANGGTNGEAEMIPEDKARWTMEINYWGAIKVALEALKVFRDVNSPQGGLFMHVSSAVGILGQPLTAPYTASKFAMEGWLDAFSQELDPKWNIKVQVLNPGLFNTPFASKSGGVLPRSPLYSSLDQDHPATKNRMAFDMIHQGVDFGLPKPNIFVDAVMQVVAKSEKREVMPFRVPVGHDSLQCFSVKAKAFSDSIKEFESLSKASNFAAPSQ